MRGLTFLVLAIVALLSGCASDTATLDGAALFLIDASESCRHQREQYRRDFRNQLLKMESTRVYIDIVAAQRVPEYPIVIDIPRRRGPLSQYSEEFDKERAAIADAADAELQALLRQHDALVAKNEEASKGSTRGSSPVLALSLVTIFGRDRIRDLKRKSLFLFTDGLEQSSELDLTSGAITTENVGDAVKRLEALGLVPRLEGVKVHVGGLAAGKGKQVSAHQILLVRKFWQLYFEISGAQFNPADLDSTVID